MKPYHVVLDTNVLVSALLSPLGNPAKIYRMLFSGTIVPIYSESILTEYKDVLHRPGLNISAEDAALVTEAIRVCGECVDPVPSTFPMIDEDDRKFYDAAKLSGAYLITGNLRHYPNEPHILTPAEFLKL